jgi:hypothetical protein
MTAPRRPAARAKEAGWLFHGGRLLDARRATALRSGRAAAPPPGGRRPPHGGEGRLVPGGLKEADGAPTPRGPRPRPGNE